MTDLRALGVRRGGVLLVHSSLSALGYVSGGAGTVIDALEEVLGAEGTLAMPAHSWAQMGKGCRTFDARRTASCVGRISEQFRRLPGVTRSMHPTHSLAARGPLADWLCADHEHSRTPCGEGSPYARIIEQRGQVLLLGVSLHVNTMFHTLEAMAGVPYLLQDAADVFTLVDYSGRSRAALIFRHRPHIRRRFAETEEVLLREGIVTIGRVGRAKTLLADAAAMRDFVVARLRKDPGFLLADGKPSAASAGRDQPVVTNT